MMDQSSELSNRFFNRLRRGALVGFLAGTALIVATPLLADLFSLEENVFVQAVFISGSALMVASAIVLVFFMLGRELIEWKRKRWRFSLSALLIGMTVLAIMLGLAAAMSRMSN